MVANAAHVAAQENMNMLRTDVVEYAEELVNVPDAMVKVAGISKLNNQKRHEKNNWNSFP